MPAQTKWIRFSPHISIAMTIDGDWMADKKEDIDRLFKLIDVFLAAEQLAPAVPTPKED